jgi:hypothetical protein
MYGGYEITVFEPDLFPWHQVSRFLIEAGQEIWIKEEEGRICIATEPKVE